MNLTTATFDADLFQLVPKRPNDEMRDRGNEVLLDRGKLFHIWDLMLAASPQQPSVQVPTS